MTPASVLHSHKLPRCCLQCCPQRCPGPAPTALVAALQKCTPLLYLIFAPPLPTCMSHMQYRGGVITYDVRLCHLQRLPRRQRCPGPIAALHKVTPLLDLISAPPLPTCMCRMQYQCGVHHLRYTAPFSLSPSTLSRPSTGPQHPSSLHCRNSCFGTTLSRLHLCPFAFTACSIKAGVITHGVQLRNAGCRSGRLPILPHIASWC